jgi:hypothetical protein
MKLKNLILQELDLKLTDEELSDMIKDASLARKQNATEEDYKHILKHSGWM